MNQVLMNFSLDARRKLLIVKGDITQEKVDVIVNAANAQLNHGGGVARAIVAQGGAIIQAESDAWVREHGPVEHGSPAYTSSGKLPSRYVIHAVGPVWGEGNEDEKLRIAILGSLLLADRLKLDSIAFPAISTGIFGFPKSRAAEIFFDTIIEYFEQYENSGLEIIRLTLFDQETVDIFMQTGELRFSRNI
jgi:O-acetyl-ADP-ribose deacetylase (regulator of RNase III)